MKLFGILLLIIGGIGIILGNWMYGDIRIAATIGAVTAVVSGIGFLRLEKLLKKPVSEV